MAAFLEVGAAAETESSVRELDNSEQLEAGKQTADLREIGLWPNKVQPCFLRKQSQSEPPRRTGKQQPG